MTTSLTQTARLTCPQCQTDFEAEIWMALDPQQEPDVYRRILDGTLHDFSCPTCRRPVRINAPLLLLRPTERPALIYSPAHNADPAEDQEQADGLLAKLRQQMGAAWQEAWLNDTAGVPRPILATYLEQGPEAAQQAWRQLQQARLEELRQQDPQGYERARASQDWLQQRSEQIELIQRFVQARTWQESQQIVEQSPQLLDEEIDAILARLIDLTEAQNNHSDSQVLNEHRSLLARCRSVGVAAAFAEKNRPASTGFDIIAPNIPEPMRPFFAALAQMPEEQRLTILEKMAQAGSVEGALQGLQDYPELRALLDGLL